MMSNFKTFSLLVLLSGIILLLGRFLGGANGLLFAFILALLMNAGSYWFSDKIVLAAYKAQPLQASDAPSLYRMLEDLSEAAQIPCPRLYLIPDSSPNAFATGRNPAHAVVAVTQGLMQLLSPDELRGVLAHEIAHIRNRDIFLQSVVAVLATIIMYAAHILQWKAIFGGGSSENSNGNSGGVAGALLLAILAPLAAALIQFAISRSREFQADKVGAEISKAPLALASALDKLARCAQRAPLHNAGQGTAHLFIVNPLGKGLRELFSTHPPVQERIRRLHAMSGQGPKIL